jgi:hypothetical protein
MAMPRIQSSPRPTTPLVPPVVKKLRFVARTCRAKARLDVFQACAMLSAHPQAAAEAYADALLRALTAGFRRPPVIYETTATEMSFDEQWLAATICAAAREDEDSLRFLLASRLPHHMRRQIGWLAAQLALRLEQD